MRATQPVDLRDLLGIGDPRPDITIRDPDALIEEQLAQIDARRNGNIVGLDGTPLLRPVVDDRTITYGREGEAYSADPATILMRAARMMRDGMSLKNIAAELDLITTGPMAVPLTKLDAAIRRFGMPWLDAAILAGTEPAESKTVTGYVAVEDAEAEDGNEAVADAEGEVETRTVKMTPGRSRRIMKALNRNRGQKPRRR